MRKLGYGERHVSTDRLIPFIPVAKSEKDDVKAEVEFITAPKFSKRVKDSLIGREIKVNEIEYFETL